MTGKMAKCPFCDFRVPLWRRDKKTGKSHSRTGEIISHVFDAHTKEQAEKLMEHIGRGLGE